MRNEVIQRNIGHLVVVDLRNRVDSTLYRNRYTKILFLMVFFFGHVLACGRFDMRVWLDKYPRLQFVNLISSFNCLVTSVILRTAVMVICRKCC